MATNFVTYVRVLSWAKFEDDIDRLRRHGVGIWNGKILMKCGTLKPRGQSHVAMAM